jgi:hypothetical protein
MNEYGRVLEEVKREYDRFSDAVEVSPTSLAWGVHSLLSSGMESDSTKYLSLEQLKQICREFLRRNKEPDGEENEAHGAQPELPLGIRFSGKLQDRYPLPRKAGEEPRYKRQKNGFGMKCSFANLGRRGLSMLTLCVLKVSSAKPHD